MKNMTKIDPKQIDENVIRLIGSQWMLVTAGNPAHFNTMTASWGGLGFLWNRPVAFVFIRPQRYTFQFAEENSGLTLSFFGEEYRDALKICGSRSGRDTDKVAEAGLTPEPTPGGNVAFGEASLVLEGRRHLPYRAFWSSGTRRETCTRCTWSRLSTSGDARASAVTILETTTQVGRGQIVPRD